MSSAILSPKYSPNDELTYDFKFRWADGYEGVRDVLVEEGLFDVQVVPGMTVPVDLEARVAIRTKTDYRLEPEFPDSTEIKKPAEKTPGIQVYAVKFAKLGENNLTLRFGRETLLGFKKLLILEPAWSPQRRRKRRIKPEFHPVNAGHGLNKAENRHIFRGISPD